MEPPIRDRGFFSQAWMRSSCTGMGCGVLLESLHSAKYSARKRAELGLCNTCRVRRQVGSNHSVVCPQIADQQPSP